MRCHIIVWLFMLAVEADVSCGCGDVAVKGHPVVSWRLERAKKSRGLKH